VVLGVNRRGQALQLIGFQRAQVVGADTRRGGGLLDGEATLAALGSKDLTQCHRRECHLMRLNPRGPAPPGHRHQSIGATTVRLKGGPAPNPASFEAQSLQQLVHVRQRHQHFTRLGSLVAADHVVLRKLVHDAAGT